jgi:N-acetylmuramoyl-L-alanine amidase
LKLRGFKQTPPRRLACFSLLFLFSLSLAAAQPVLKVESHDYEDYSRVIITFPEVFPYTLQKTRSFLQVNIKSPRAFRLDTRPLRSRFIESLSGNTLGDSYILVIEARDSNYFYDSFNIEKTRQLVIDFYPGREEPAVEARRVEGKTAPEPEKEKAEERPAPAYTSTPPRKPESSVVKGVRTIVIDPGHGGVESGAKGKFGALEKDITLALGLKLKAVIEKNLAYHVELTRETDMDVSLDDRAAIANNHKADLFISLHANSSRRRNAQGSETFFLSLNATDEEARRLAYLENSSAQFEKPIDDRDQDEIRMILWDMAQSAYLKQSQRLAEIIQDELNSLLGTANRGIKQARFKVLEGVACPAVLVEVAFISNPEEERELVRETFQDSVVQAIYRGIVTYVKLTS